MGTRSDNVWIERRLIESRAFRALRTPTAHVVLGMFWTKRQMVKVGRSGKRRWEVANNNDITFTYREAERKWGISANAFRTAVDELRDKGFLDIAESGAGLYKSTNRYRLSDRWGLYDTPDYQPAKQRPRGPINKGFKRGNQYGRNCRQKKTTVEVQHGPTVVAQHSPAETRGSHVVGSTKG